MAKKTADSSSAKRGLKLFKRGSRKSDDAPKKKRFARTRELWQAYKLLKPNDPKLGIWILGTAILGFLIGFWGMLLLAGTGILGVILAIVAGLLLGLLGGMIVFGMRARKTTYRQAEGRPGAASWALDQMRGDWRITQAVSVSATQDLVHRVIGRPGIILVGEGENKHRIGSLIGQEKKRIARVVGETPIYTVVVGDDADAGEVTLKKLNKHVMKLPRNIQGAQIRALEKRLQAVASPKMPLPKGPMPGGRKMEVTNRQMRRRGMGQ
ncbi:DUF4191 domain-containing protein [Cumulibacter soli]|uniref:DUF4191 domain-containing protein n=1 Tax=Cumulibacter soli TaxID=2546344 RepID=UPI001067B338|nr:DUF4191 domain-containing protein [Cumulibacter soli]